MSHLQTSTSLPTLKNKCLNSPGAYQGRILNTEQRKLKTNPGLQPGRLITPFGCVTISPEVNSGLACGTHDAGNMNEQLLGYLFDDKPHGLAAQMGEWIGSSRRFKAFATTYRDKIRKKIRVTQTDTGVKDLAAELETAFWLLEDRRLAVVYEPYGHERRRGPDFAVTFKSITFNVEVTRIGRRDGEAAAWDAEQVGIRLMDTVCDKLGQMRPGMINVLVVVADEAFAAVLDVDGVMTRLKARAERKEAGLFGRYGFVNTADFFKHYLRLSGVLVRPIGGGRSVLWVNQQAKHAMPGGLRNKLQVAGGR